MTRSASRATSSIDASPSNPAAAARLLVRALRFSAVALLCLALAKLFLHDLDALSQLYRIAAFITVAIIAIVASFAYQRFLSPAVKK